MRVICQYPLTERDHSPVGIQEIDDSLLETFRTVRNSSPAYAAQVDPIVRNGDNGTRWFDGVRTVQRAFVYDDDFDIRRYDELVNNAVEETPRANKQILDTLGLDTGSLEQDEPEEESPDFSPTFQ
jgi:hypothetical protein